jgi:hypothetical protein
MLHVIHCMLMMVLDVTAMLESIVMSQMLGNVVMVVNMPTFSVMTTMLFHVFSHMLMMVLDMTAMLHIMNVTMLLGVRMLDMMQMGFAAMLSPTTMEGMLVVSNMIVMFHD